MNLQKIAEVGSSPKKKQVQEILDLFVTLDIDIPDFQELSIRDATRRLKKKRNLLARHSPDFSKIDSILLLLLKLEYRNPFQARPCDINDINKRLFPQEYSVLSYINEKLLFTKVSDLLEVKYLSNCVVDWNWEENAKGIVFGEFSRPMISFPVHVNNNTPIMVHFRIDTGAPNSQVPVNVFEALIGSTPDYIPSAFYGSVGGVRLELGICSESGIHVDIPLLGQDFLKEGRVEIKVNYVTKIVEMNRIVL